MDLQQLKQQHSAIVERLVNTSLDLAEAHRLMARVSGAVATLADLKQELFQVQGAIDRLKSPEEP